MTDQERIEKLRQALVAARYEIVYWAEQASLARWKRARLGASLKKYDAVIAATETSQ